MTCSFDTGSGQTMTGVAGGCDVALVARRVVVRHNDAGRNANPFMVRLVCPNSARRQ